MFAEELVVSWLRHVLPRLLVLGVRRGAGGVVAEARVASSAGAGGSEGVLRDSHA